MSEFVGEERLQGGAPWPLISLRRYLTPTRTARAPGRPNGVAVLNRTIPAAEGVTVVSRGELAQCERWTSAFVFECKDRRYYEIVEDTLHPEFEHHYLVIRDETGAARAVQPYFIRDIDLLEGVSRGIKSAAGLIRRLWPRFMFLRTLMLGCAAGAGQLDGKEHVQAACARQLGRSLLERARLHKAGLIVLKEFSAKYRQALQCVRQHGFTRMPSMPMARLNIEYSSFDEYMTQALSRATRKDLRRKFKVAGRAAPIEMSVVSDVSPFVNEVYPLYVQVYERSSLHFEKLTPEYLCELGRRMPDKARFFIWRQSGRAIAFSICMVQGDSIYDEYIGLDYSIALKLHLYHYTFRDIFTWAVANGYKWYRSNGLNYDPKLHLKCRLEPLDLYVRHTSPAISLVLSSILSWLGPTHHDKHLKRFPNYRELWGDR
jgi:Acetyltransferase (GNAT) domain